VENDEQVDLLNINQAKAKYKKSQNEFQESRKSSKEDKSTAR